MQLFPTNKPTTRQNQWDVHSESAVVRTGFKQVNLQPGEQPEEGPGEGPEEEPEQGLEEVHGSDWAQENGSIEDMTGAFNEAIF